jgi:hypothetical protein
MRLMVSIMTRAGFVIALTAAASAQVLPLPTAQTAIVGRFAQGPIDLPIVVGAAEFQTWFSSGNAAAWPAEVQAREFFANGGTSLYIVRVRDTGPLPDALVGQASDYSGIHALEPVSDLRVLIAPELSLLPANSFSDVFAVFRAFAEARRIFFILDPPPDITTAAAMINWVNTAVPDPARFCAVYYPYLQVQLDGGSLTIPPCGAMAAIWAKSDAAQGIWKAPAGSGFPLQATGVTPALNSTDSSALNTAGIDAIRQFAGTGIIAFGARTLARSNDSSRYIPFARTQDWVAASIQRALAIAAIRDDAEPLWSEITTLVQNFLQSLWIQGAFQGTTPNQAYFVHCDATTTTPADVAAHRVNVLYGMALQQPAEFDLTQLSAATYDSLLPIPAPSIRVRNFAGQLFLPYPTVPGFNYILQSRTDLSSGSWSNGSSIGGDGAWRIPTVPINGAHAFYRLEVSPAR